MGCSNSCTACMSNRRLVEGPQIRLDEVSGPDRGVAEVRGPAQQLPMHLEMTMSSSKAGPAGPTACWKSKTLRVQSVLMIHGSHPEHSLLFTCRNNTGALGSVSTYHPASNCTPQPLLFFHFHVAADGHPVDQHGEYPHNLEEVAVKGNELSLDPQTGDRGTCMKLG